MFSWVIIFLSFKIMFIFILLSNDPVQLQLLKSEIDTFSCPAAVFFFFFSFGGLELCVSFL